MTMRALAVSIVMVLASGDFVLAQAPAGKNASPVGVAANPVAAKPAAATPPSANPASTPAAQLAKPSRPAPQDAYTYQADGRRDPFLSLLGTGAETRMSRKGEGAAAMTVNELSVRGVLQSRGALVAMIEGPDRKTYIVHSGDKLADGTIKTITPQGLVVIQEVNDPLSLVKQREVRKLLRSLEDAKE